MFNEMESAGIRFEVQWKKKSGVVGRREDVTSIGLWDPEDSTLDWKTFKTYLCQNIGTMGDISVAYVDSEGDELPIESECEFQEALKFARERARKGRETLLKVDRQGSTSSDVVSKPLMVRCDKLKHGKLSNKSLHKVSGVMDTRASTDEKKKIKLKKHGDHHVSDKMHVENMEMLSKLMGDMNAKTDSSSSSSSSQANLESEDVAPQWFKKYMHKLKTEIVNEVTSRVLHGMQQVLDRQASSPSTRNAVPGIKIVKKKKVSDEDSSDGALGGDSRDHKLLKKIEKLHKREKKLEKKLDSKLEKLENKTKRMMEKKSQSKARCERAPEKKVSCVPRKKSSDILPGTYLMDAILLNDSPKTELHIQPGKRFCKIWEIMNTGTLPWTDKTELRQAWGTMGFEPEETVVKCPILEPGEKGQIAVNFRAPEYPGTFESYWHFHHMGVRFGHWISCAVVVDSKEERCVKKEEEPNKEPQNEHPVGLTVKPKLEQKVKTGTKLNVAEQPKDPEYESDSDSDNLSIISATVSLSSDSEEDDNFVHVPMPACFLCDVPLGSVDTVPVVVKESERKAINTDQCPVVTKKSSEMMQQETGELHCDSHPVENNQEAQPNEAPQLPSIEDNNHTQGRVFESRYIPESLEPESLEFREYPTSKIYAVDMAGHCMPIETQHFGGTRTHVTVTTSTSSSSGSTSSTTTHSQQRTSPSDVIHILPETLVSGAVNAVNVATSAFSTARAVISNLRSKPPGDHGDWSANGCNETWTAADRSTTDNSKLLVEMGFTNKVLNVLLLQRYDNDVTKVVAELLTYDENGANGYRRLV